MQRAHVRLTSVVSQCAQDVKSPNILIREQVSGKRQVIAKLGARHQCMLQLGAVSCSSTASEGMMCVGCCTPNARRSQTLGSGVKKTRSQ